MNILLLMNPYRKDAQNYRVVKMLFDEIAKTNRVLCVYPSYSLKAFFENKRHPDHFTFFFFNSKNYINFAYKKINECKHHFFKLIALGLSHPIFSIIFLYRKLYLALFKETIEAKKLFRRAQKCSQKLKPSVIFGVSNPFLHASLITKFSNQQLKVWYQLDPHTLSGTIENKYMDKEREVEHKLYQKSDLVILQPFNSDKIKQTEFAIYEKKFFPLEFPLIRNTNDLLSRKLDPKDGIHCIFAGAIDPAFRNPTKMFIAFQNLPFSNVFLHVFSPDISNEMRAENNAKYGSRIIFHAYVDFDQMLEYLKGADFLVNLGNNSSIFFPSKLFDYFSMGKPVINFYKFDKCPTLPMIKKYALAIGIFENDKPEDQVNALSSFISKHKDVKMGYDDICQSFYDFTPKAVAEKLMNRVNELLKEKYGSK